MGIPLLVTAILALLGDAAFTPMGEELRWLWRLSVLCGVTVGFTRHR